MSHFAVNQLYFNQIKQTNKQTNLTNLQTEGGQLKEGKKTQHCLLKTASVWLHELVGDTSQ